MKFKNIVGIGIVIWLVNYFGGENGIFKRWFGHQPESRRIEYVERSPGLADVDDQAKGLASRFIEWIGFYNEADAAIHSNHNRHVAEEAWRDTTRINTEIERTKLQRRIQDLDHRERNQKLREQNASLV